MDYEKKYNEALMRADEAVQKGCLDKGMFDIIFPPDESEDERIRKQCIELLREAYSTKYEAFECIAWLEKQKEQKPTDLPAGFYFIDLDGNKYYSKEFRYGDMKLKVGEQKPCGCVNVESEYDKGWRAGHKAGLKDAEMQKPLETPSPSVIYTEQGEVLAEQKPAEWSEEDDKMRDRIIDILNRTFSVYSAIGTSSTRPSCPTYKDEIDWLKSLRTQKNCPDCSKHLEGYISGRGDAENKLLEQYGILIMPEGELRMKPRWKPSEEQMKALLWCTAHLGGADRRVLAELYEHLKKLI